MTQETMLSAIAMFDNRVTALFAWMDKHHPEVELHGITPAIRCAFFAHETQRVIPVTAE